MRDILCRSPDAKLGRFYNTSFARRRILSLRTHKGTLVVCVHSDNTAVRSRYDGVLDSQNHLTIRKKNLRALHNHLQLSETRKELSATSRVRPMGVTADDAAVASSMGN